jgi:fucose 4-O-acetylase-like acetyltransferase
MGSRLEHIDVAKGIGIILVVLGHNWIIRTEKGELFRIIFSFHMPLFFFLSGVLFKAQSDFRHTFGAYSFLRACCIGSGRSKRQTPAERRLC